MLLCLKLATLARMAQSTGLDGIRDRLTLITFDCYGTLVDWEAGLRAAIREVSGRDDPALFDAYLATEAEIEAESYRPYREVLAEALRRVAEQFDFTVPQDRANALAETLPRWPLWPDTNAALQRLKSRYRIGVLSNIDRDLFAGTAGQFTIDIDLLVTAEDVRSYKPSHDHFLRMFEQEDGGREVVLHAAQSLYHDCVPATHLGIANVWINRRGEANETDAEPLAEFPDIAGLADALLGPATTRASVR